VVLTPRRWRQVARGACWPDRVRHVTSPRGDGGKRARSPGRARRTPLKPLRREGRMIRLYLWFCRVLFVARGPWVRAGTRPSLRPLFVGRELLDQLGRIARRERERVFGLPSLRGGLATKQSRGRMRYLSLAPGLLRFARNDDEGLPMTLPLSIAPRASFARLAPTRGKGAHRVRGGSSMSPHHSITPRAEIILKHG
jgi:hypothetical protein